MTNQSTPIKETQLTPELLQALGSNVQAYFNRLFVGNQCGSDEYRETQPANSLGLIAEVSGLVQERLEDIQYDYQDETLMQEAEQLMLDYQSFLTLTRPWTAAWLSSHDSDSYAGAQEAETFHSKAFNLLWQLGSVSGWATGLEDLIREWNEDIIGLVSMTQAQREEFTPELIGQVIILNNPITGETLQGV